MYVTRIPAIVFCIVMIGGCSSDEGGVLFDGGDALFDRLDPQATGVTFRNEIIEREGLNVLTYEYFFNGGGVAAGDLDGDGRPDLYFTANMGPNALYINEGEMRFRDATADAGVAGGPGWTTGVTMADVNGDGRLDIYICKSGKVSEPLRRNELYINNGDGTFTERAEEFGLDDPSYSTHASFFDYDGDGDLDMFLVNHAVERYSRFDVDLFRQMRDPLSGDKLYRNDDGRFVDVTVEAGIYGNPIGFGLSAMTVDVNADGHPDIFVANDYIEDDYLYMNNGDGTFTEELRLRFGHTSYSSMGTDIADINNDGLPDIFTLDMMSEDPIRRKLLQGPNNFEQVRSMLESGYFRQYMRNMLQLNNGNGTFSEIGQLAGVAETDWSWAPLIADFDNDGLKDLFVTNGYLRDYTNMDFLMSILQDSLRMARMTGNPIDADAIVREMPQTSVPNYVFRNVDGLTFEKRSTEWGVDAPSFSNGAAYADLDGDGDLDLVVSNINDEPFIYRNQADRLTSNRYLRVRLEGDRQNPFGVGARIEARADRADADADGGERFLVDLQPSRGYLSSVEPVIHLGVGESERVDLTVTWPDGRRQIIEGVPTNQHITLSARDAAPPESSDGAVVETAESPYFVDVPDRLGLDFVHTEDEFVDFERDPLLPHMHSRLGPAMAVADVNGDGLVDVFFGGARGQSAALYLQQSDGTFASARVAAFVRDADYEDVDATFFDADSDGDLDLYVVSGGSRNPAPTLEGAGWSEGDETSEGGGGSEAAQGSESPQSSGAARTPEGAPASIYQDRMYYNSGFGRFQRAEVLPDMPVSGGTVAPHDFDGDGDVDLFVGGRVVPGSYPLPPRSYLLENRDGLFVDVTPARLRKVGMATTAVWADIDADGNEELIVAGEWMPIRAFRIEAEGGQTQSREQTQPGGRAQSGAQTQRGGQTQPGGETQSRSPISLQEITEEAGLGRTSGWWNVLLAHDWNGDGLIDLVAGNRGLNHTLGADEDTPLTLLADDLGYDGIVDPILIYSADGERYPVAWRDEMLQQVPSLVRNFPTYASYAGATVEDLLGPGRLEDAIRLDAYEFATCVFENLGDGTFLKHRLPTEVQIAPVNDAITLDINMDGLSDLLLAGNNYAARAQWGAFTAGRGTLLINRGDMDFQPLTPVESGIFAPGDVRRLALVPTRLGSLVAVANNDDELQTFGVNYRDGEPPLAGMQDGLNDR